MASLTKKTSIKRKQRDDKIARSRQKKTRVRDRKLKASGALLIS